MTQAATATLPAPLIELQGVSKTFSQPGSVITRVSDAILQRPARKQVWAVDDVSLTIKEGEVVGLVGESGCGKSTLGRMAAFIHQPTSGNVLYEGRSVWNAPASTFRDAQLRTQMIFQDPFASLNPRFRVRDIIGEAPLMHGLIDKSEVDDYVDELLKRVGINPAFRFRFPHQFSGGQRQRISIARALAVKPRVLVCDESVSALDVSVQAQILNLFMELRDDLGLSYLLISHDLSVVRHISDSVAVMYLGRVVEQAPAQELFEAPNHPYSRLLMAGLPTVKERHKRFEAIPGELPSPMAPPPGCHFHTRCPEVMPICSAGVPELLPVGSQRLAACHLNTSTDLKVHHAGKLS